MVLSYDENKQMVARESPTCPATESPLTYRPSRLTAAWSWGTQNHCDEGRPEYIQAAWVCAGEAWRFNKSETSSRLAVKNVPVCSLRLVLRLDQHGTLLQVYAIASHRSQRQQH